MTFTTVRGFLAATLAASLGAVAIAAGPPSGYTFAVVATLDTAAPGGYDHEGDFEPEDINGRGDVVFASDLADEQGGTIGEGLFGRYQGTNRLIARSGDPIPGTTLFFGPFGILSPGGMNDSGDVAFGFTIDVPFVEFGTNAAVFRYDSVKRTLFPVFLPGDPAPDGTTFRGAGFHTDLNNRGQIATVALIDTPNGNCQDPAASCYGLGRGVYTFDRLNRATRIAAPGDNAPGSTSWFDDAWDPNLNNRGDVVFGGHVAGETCDGGSSVIGCLESLYLYDAASGRVSSIVHRGDAAPGGGWFLLAWNGRLNDGGDASFMGGFEAVDPSPANGVFLRTRSGALIKVARPGDPLPGGTMKTGTFTQGGHAIDNAGHVAFAAQLDADINQDGIEDTGVYLWSNGAITTVVKTGTVIPLLGQVKHVNNAYYVGGSWPWPGVHMNERGQIFTQVTLDSGETYAVVATPK